MVSKEQAALTREAIDALVTRLRDMRDFSEREGRRQRRLRNAYEAGARFAEASTLAVVIAELETLTHGD